jgi:hypothetical protein
MTATRADVTYDVEGRLLEVCTCAASRWGARLRSLVGAALLAAALVLTPSALRRQPFAGTLSPEFV